MGRRSCLGRSTESGGGGSEREATEGRTGRPWAVLTAAWIGALVGASIAWQFAAAVLVRVLPLSGNWATFALSLGLALSTVLVASVIMGVASERMGVRGALSWAPGVAMVVVSGLPRQVGLANRGFGQGGWIGLLSLALACASVPLGVRVGRALESRGAARLNLEAGVVEPVPSKRPHGGHLDGRPRTYVLLALGVAAVVVALSPLLGVWQASILGVGPLPVGRYDESSDRYLFYMHDHDGRFAVQLEDLREWRLFQYEVHPTPATVWKLDGKRVTRDEFVRAVTAGEAVENGSYIEYENAWFDVGADGGLVEVNEVPSEAVTVTTDDDGTINYNSRPLP